MVSLDFLLAFFLVPFRVDVSDSLGLEAFVALGAAFFLFFFLGGGSSLSAFYTSHRERKRGREKELEQFRLKSARTVINEQTNKKANS